MNSNNWAMPTNIPWRRIVAEGTVIVVSILFALAVDAWWNARQARSEEATRLAAVRVELREARIGFVTHLEELANDDSLAVQILREVRQYSGNAALLDSLMFVLGPFTEYAPPLAAYDDATSPGGLSLISSDTTRRMLSRYRGLVESDLLEQRIAREHFDRQMAPLWLQYVSARDHFAVGTTMLPGLLPSNVPEVPFRSLYSEMLQDRRFANQIIERIFANFRIRRLHTEALRSIDELLAKLSEVPAVETERRHNGPGVFVTPSPRVVDAASDNNVPPPLAALAPVKHGPLPM